MERLLRQDWFRFAVAVTYAFVCSMSLGSLLLRIDTWSAVPVVLGALCLGYAIADLVSGIIHSLADHFGTKDTPIVGALFIQPFRDHHHDPDQITQESFLELCMPAMFTATPPMVVGLLLNLFWVSSPSTLWLPTLLWIVPMGGVLACITHRLAHDDDRSPMIRKLQALGLILTPKDHDAHHRDGHYTRFCILNGWMNPVLDFFIKIAKASRRPASGIKARSTLV